MLLDRDKHKQTVSCIKDALLPAWSTDGTRLAWVQKAGRKKYNAALGEPYRRRAEGLGAEGCLSVLRSTVHGFPTGPKSRSCCAARYVSSPKPRSARTFANGMRRSIFPPT